MRHDHYYHHPTQHIERKVDDLLCALQTMERTIMTKIQDFATNQNAFNVKISNDLDTIATNITALNTLIATLQNSAGGVTPEDQATIDQLQAAGQELQNKADALVSVASTPPVAKG